MRSFPVVSALLVITLTGATNADTVKLTGRAAFHNVRVCGFHAGQLRFQGVSRQFLRKPFDEIEWIAVDDAPSLTRAEAAWAKGDWARAAAAYRDAIRRADHRWQRDLAQLRLLVAADRAGDFALAVEMLITLGPRLGPELAAYQPRNVAPAGSPENRRAGILLQRALRAEIPTSRRAICRRLLLELAIYEEVAPFPTALYEAGDAVEGSHSDPNSDEPLGILPPARPDTAGGRAPLPDLPRDSFLLTALAAELDAGHADRVRRVLERALRYVPRDRRGPWRLLAGRAAIQQGAYAEAASELMEIAASDSAPAVSAWALYYVGVAHERMDRPEVAQRLYQDLIDQQPPVPPDLLDKARTGVTRLGGE